MAEMNDIVKLAVDSYHGNVEKYSVGQANDVLRQALIDANNGKTSLNYRDIRDGKCSGLFAIIEEILGNTVVEGLTEDAYFNTLVDFRNIALGDQNLFVTEDNDLYVVAEAAEGTQGIRRQRLAGRNETPIETTLKVVRIYEELNRVLAGRVDFNAMINKVAESFRQQLLTDVNTLWDNVVADDIGGTDFFPAAGAFNADTLLKIIDHVEAAAGGKRATIIGTKAAARLLTPAVQGADSQSDIYNTGFYGMFYGTPVITIPQRHKAGTTEFVYDTDTTKTLTIVATADKPIKVVYEGDPLVIMGDPLTNADLTQEFLYGDRYGVGLVTAGNAGIGRYVINA